LAHRAAYYFSDAESDLRIIDELVIPSNQRRKQVLGNIVFNIVTPWYSAPRNSLNALLVGRRVGMMHIVCYLRQRSRVFETYWTTRRGVEAMDNSYRLLDLTVYGRQHGVDRCRPVGSDLSQEGGDCSGCLAPRVNLAAVSGTDPNLTARPDVKNNTARGARPVPQVRASATPAAA
jgi:hypothetical protein